MDKEGVMDKEIVFCDLDGTLIDEDENRIAKVYCYLIENYTMRYIITGRSKTSLSSIMDLNNLLKDFETNIICYNGNALWDWKSDRLMKINYIDKSYAIVNELIKKGIEFVVDFGDEIYSSTKGSALRYSIYNKVPRNSIIIGVNEYKIHALIFHIYCKSEKLEVVKKIFKNEEIRYEYWPLYLIVYPRNTDKANGIKYILNKYENIDCKITTLGNDYNDIGMTCFADCGIAVSNSPLELKEKADIIL